MLAPEVTQFCLAVPAAAEAAFAAAGERLIHGMQDEFPDLNFVVAINEVLFGPANPSTEPRAFPIMSAGVQEGGAIFMCKEPDPDLVQAVNRRLAAFDLAGRRLS